MQHPMTRKFARRVVVARQPRSRIADFPADPCTTFAYCDAGAACLAVIESVDPELLILEVGNSIESSSQLLRFIRALAPADQLRIAAFAPDNGSDKARCLKDAGADIVLVTPSGLPGELSIDVLIRRMGTPKTEADGRGKGRKAP